jgi:hypothetical protein
MVISTIFSKITSLHPDIALCLRSQLVAYSILPAIQVDLTVRFIFDEMAFLSGLLRKRQHFEAVFTQQTCHDLRQILISHTKSVSQEPDPGIIYPTPSL